MKKFSQVNNQKDNKPTSKKEYIDYVINETLKVEKGKIIGKDILAKVFEKILEINDHKTTISVLENVKVLSRQNFDFNWINNAIEEEKIKLSNVNVDKEQPVEIKDEIILESKSEKKVCACDCENCDCKTCECKCDGEKCDCMNKPVKEKKEDETDETDETDDNTTICKCDGTCKKCKCTAKNCKCKEKKSNKLDEKVIEFYGEQKTIISEDKYQTEMNSLNEIFKCIPNEKC